MTESIRNLINALREELQQYGEMLALLDRQQELVIARHAQEVMHCATLIQTQGAAIQTARSQRETARRTVAEELFLERNASFATLTPMLPPDYRPLVNALVEENNALLVRVQKRARQNHLLLSRSVEFMQNFIDSLFPAREARVYDDHGGMQSHTLLRRPLYEGLG